MKYALKSWVAYAKDEIVSPKFNTWDEAYAYREATRIFSLKIHNSDIIKVNMKTHLEQVEEFHKTFKHPIKDTHGIDPERAKLRLNLLLEELIELAEASELGDWFGKRLREVATNNGTFDPLEQLDALADIQYVLSGAVLEYGFKDVFDAAFAEVHRSNMSKAHENSAEAMATVIAREESTGEACDIMKNEETGKFLVNRISDGKTIKNINYSPANLKQFIK